MCMIVCNCLYSLLDEGSFVELGSEFELKDVLKFCDFKKYKDCLVFVQKEIGEKDVLVVMKGILYGMLVVVAVFEFVFMGGLMGFVVGVCFVCVVEQVLEDNCLLICFFVFGGVCMQEVLMLLMQMVKIFAVLVKMQECGLLYIFVLIDLMMGGVFVSFVMLGDFNIVELKVLIGFVGLCVIEQIVCEKLLFGFQCSEFLIEKGVIDMIVCCLEMCLKLVSILVKLMNLLVLNFEVLCEGVVVFLVLDQEFEV